MRRRAEGKPPREVVRCLKRYFAREVFHVLQRLTPISRSLDTIRGIPGFLETLGLDAGARVGDKKNQRPSEVLMT